MSKPSSDHPVAFGNAADLTDTRGWIVGHFVSDHESLRYSQEVEVKWGMHKAGERRQDWVTGEARTTLAILVSGKWEMLFRDQTITLIKPGDFVMWGKGIDHKWRAVEDSVLITIRWPSVA